MLSSFNFLCSWKSKLTSQCGFLLFLSPTPMLLFSTAAMVLYATSASGPCSALLGLGAISVLIAEVLSPYPSVWWNYLMKKLGSKNQTSLFHDFIIFGFLLLRWWTIWKFIFYPSWHRGRYSGLSHGTFHFFNACHFIIRSLCWHT